MAQAGIIDAVGADRFHDTLSDAVTAFQDSRQEQT